MIYKDDFQDCRTKEQKWAKDEGDKWLKVEGHERKYIEREEINREGRSNAEKRYKALQKKQKLSWSLVRQEEMIELRRKIFKG